MLSQGTEPSRVPSPYPLRVSVVIPVYNSASYLDRCLTALAASEARDLEVLVVDDGSTDDSRAVAERHGAKVLRLEGNRGPSYARNRGAEASTGDVVLFVDADVCLRPDTVTRMVEVFESRPHVAAVIGSYDDLPDDPGFFSQYKNLLHHFVHQCSRTRAHTFWSGCGAVRRSVFLELGGFNEQYAKPCIEDIEFGFRMAQAEHVVWLERRARATHLKRWGFVDLVKTDVFRRGVPWVALMLRDRQVGRDLNLSRRTKSATLFAYLYLVAALMLLLGGHGGLLLPVVVWLGWGVASAALYNVMPWSAWRRVSVAGYVPAAAFIWLSGSLNPLSALANLPLVAIGVLGLRQFRFLRRKHGTGFALASFPFHVLFLLYSGLCIPLGILAYALDQRQARRFHKGPAAPVARPLTPSAGTASESAEQLRRPALPT